MNLAAAMLAASRAGSSLRTIGEAIGFSHEKVRTMLAREEQRQRAVIRTLDRPIAALTVAERQREEARRRRLRAGLSVKETDG
jgi:hypothetical protein